MSQVTEDDHIVTELTETFTKACNHRLDRGGGNVLRKFIQLAVINGIVKAGGYSGTRRTYLLCRFENIAIRVNKDRRGAASREVLLDACDAEVIEANRDPTKDCVKISFERDDESLRRRRQICEKYTREELEKAPTGVEEQAL